MDIPRVVQLKFQVGHYYTCRFLRSPFLYFYVECRSVLGDVWTRVISGRKARAAKVDVLFQAGEFIRRAKFQPLVVKMDPVENLVDGSTDTYIRDTRRRCCITSLFSPIKIK